MGKPVTAPGVGSFTGWPGLTRRGRTRLC